jgi:hypothetical protein
MRGMLPARNVVLAGGNRRGAPETAQHANKAIQAIHDYIHRDSFGTETTTLARANTRIWQRHYLPSPLYEPYQTWEQWLSEFRMLIVEVQEIAAGSVDKER